MNNEGETATGRLHRIKDEVAAEWHFTSWNTVPAKFTHKMWPEICEKYSSENIKKLESDLLEVREKNENLYKLNKELIDQGDEVRKALKYQEELNDQYFKDAQELQKERDELKQEIIDLTKSNTDLAESYQSVGQLWDKAEKEKAKLQESLLDVSKKATKEIERLKGALKLIIDDYENHPMGLLDTIREVKESLNP